MADGICLCELLTVPIDVNETICCSFLDGNLSLTIQDSFETGNCFVVQSHLREPSSSVEKSLPFLLYRTFVACQTNRGSICEVQLIVSIARGSDLNEA